LHNQSRTSNKIQEPQTAKLRAVTSNRRTVGRRPTLSSSKEGIATVNGWQLRESKALLNLEEKSKASNVIRQQQQKNLLWGSA
jgi:hypothetical protein